MPSLAVAGAVPAVPAAPVLSLRGIRKSFGATEALRGVDLDLFAGECLGLVGDNAAGKSTLTKIMSGAYAPDAGELRLAGEALRFRGPGDARERGIETVYQDLSLCDSIDVAGNLYLGRELVRGSVLDKASMRAGARRMLDALHIRIPDLDRRVERLSGGQRQSIAIARAASFAPRVLLLDEPTSALAVAEVEAVLALIGRVRAQGVGVVLITHRLQDVFRVCDRIAVMYEGTKSAERRTTETTLDELVRLIVGGA